jgi:hypothetical protein
MSTRLSAGLVMTHGDDIAPPHPALSPIELVIIRSTSDDERHGPRAADRVMDTLEDWGRRDPAGSAHIDDAKA